MTIDEQATPRVRVLQSLSHRQPSRCPFAWGFGPTGEMGAVLDTELSRRGLSWSVLSDAVTDILLADPDYVGPHLPEGVDIWGTGRSPAGYDGGEYSEMSHFPLAGSQTVADIEHHSWPSPDWFDFAGFRHRILTLDPLHSRAIRTWGGNPFEIYCWMTGLEESLTNLIACPQVVEAALTQITDFFCERLRRIIAVAGDLVDLVFLADDLGSQTGLLISRKHYRAVIQPFHRRLTETVRQHAPHAKCLFHTDGAVFDIIPDLIDSGIDILEAVQTDAAGMDPERLKATFGNAISFHGAISVQHDLPYGTPAAVASHCRHLIQTLGAGGGYIAAPSHAIQLGTPVENILAMLQTVLGDDDYEAAISLSRLT